MKTAKKAPPKTPWLTKPTYPNWPDWAYGTNESPFWLCAPTLYRIFDIPRHEEIRVSAASRTSRFTVTVSEVDDDLFKARIDGRRLDIFIALARWLKKATDKGYRHFYIEYR